LSIDEKQRKAPRSAPLLSRFHQTCSDEKAAQIMDEFDKEYNLHEKLSKKRRQEIASSGSSTAILLVGEKKKNMPYAEANRQIQIILDCKCSFLFLPLSCFICCWTCSDQRRQGLSVQRLHACN
jgi:hypothetical protein